MRWPGSPFTKIARATHAWMERFWLAFMIMIVFSVTLFSSFVVIELELCESLAATSSNRESEFAGYKISAHLTTAARTLWTIVLHPEPPDSFSNTSPFLKSSLGSFFLVAWLHPNACHRSCTVSTCLIVGSVPLVRSSRSVAFAISILALFAPANKSCESWSRSCHSWTRSDVSWSWYKILDQGNQDLDQDFFNDTSILKSMMWKP